MNAVVAAVTNILRRTCAFMLASNSAVILRYGTSASFGPIPIRRNSSVSITPEAAISLCLTTVDCQPREQPQAAVI